MKEQDDKPLTEQDLVSLTLGQKTPANEKEREILEQIKEIKTKGRIVEIPHDL